MPTTTRAARYDVGTSSGGRKRSRAAAESRARASEARQARCRPCAAAASGVWSSCCLENLPVRTEPGQPEEMGVASRFGIVAAAVTRNATAAAAARRVAWPWAERG